MLRTAQCKRAGSRTGPESALVLTSGLLVGGRPLNRSQVIQSGTHNNAVTHLTHVFGVTCDGFSLALFSLRLGKARELNRAIECFHADGGCRNRLVFGHLCLHGSGDASVVDISASRLLVTSHGTAG